MLATMAHLKEEWRRIVPDMPFAYSFLDEDVDRLYRTEERLARTVTYSSACAILIACLGTLGLTSLAVARRTKEIGIRKVLGASTPNIVSLLSREFVLLALAANIVAWPFVYYAMSEWLQSFAYRIDLEIGVFVVGGILTLAVVLLTVGFQTAKAAFANPVDALRYE